MSASAIEAVPSERGSSGSDDGPVTSVVRRRVKPGCEAAFEAAMREFIAFALKSNGNQGGSRPPSSMTSAEVTVLGL